jgi:hypothetical protein
VKERPSGYFSEPLVRPGGLIAFHGIAMNYEETYVKKLWDELKLLHEHWEYLFHQEHNFRLRCDQEIS